MIYKDLVESSLNGSHDGVVTHSHGEWSHEWEMSRRRRTQDSDQFGRLVCACYVIAFDIVIFLMVIFYMIATHKDRRSTIVKVGGHSFFRREISHRPLHTSKTKVAFFTLLLFQPHSSVSGHLLQPDLHHDSGVDSFEHPSAIEEMKYNHGYDGDSFSLLARAESSHDVVDVDAGVDNVQEDDLSGAYLFQLGANPIPARVEWGNYWALHDSISRACNWHVDDLVAIHHVASPPEDLEDIDIYVVIPQHHNDLRHGDVKVLVLVDIEFHEDTSFSLFTSREARAVPKLITRHNMLTYMDVDQYCGWKDDSCLVWVNRRIWAIQDKANKQLNHGDFLRIALPPAHQRYQCEASTREIAHQMRRNVRRTEGAAGSDALREVPERGDEVTLMQFGPVMLETGHTPSSVETKVINLYAWGQDYIEVPLEEHLSMVESISSNWGIDAADIVDLHEVLEPPMFLQVPGELVFVMEMKGDAQRRLFDDDKLILSEVRIVNIDSKESKSRRIVMWSRRIMQRFIAVGLLRMEAFCARSSTKECVLLHNNRVWTKDDRSAHRMDHGDFLLIEAYVDDISLNEAWDELKRHEEHECNRRLYTSHVDHSAIYQDAEECTFSEGAAMDQEGGAPGSEEDSPWDSLPPGDAGTIEDADDLEGLGLIQVRSGRCKAEEAPQNLILAEDVPSDDEEFLLQVDISFQRHSCEGLRPPGNPEDSSEWISSGSCNQPPLEPDYVEGSPVREERPHSSANQQQICFHLPEGIESIASLFQPWLWSPLRIDIPAECNIPAIGLQYLAGCRIGWHDDITHLHVYTDGSFSAKDEVAASAFVVFGTVGPHGKRSFIGWKGGTIITDSSDGHYTGASAHSALEAEASALVWSHIWTIQCRIRVNFSFYFDSCAAGNAASGLWCCNPSWVQGKKLRELVQLSSAVVGSHLLNYEHVKAHSRQPCNELVDALAKFSTTIGNRDIQMLPAWEGIFKADRNVLGWSWWYIGSLMHTTSQPRLGDICQQWALPSRSHKDVHRVRDIVQKEILTDTKMDLHLSLATYNVLTLSEFKCADVEGGEHWRAALLREQLESRKIHVAGLQETRANNHILIKSPNYIRVIGGNPEGSGHHGCELWLSTTLPIAWKDEKQVVFSQDDITVLRAEPRLLTVRVQPHKASIIFIVCHMPHEGSDQDLKDEWWGKLRDDVGRYSKLGFCFLLGDFNARLDTANHPHVGGRLNGDGSDNGDRMMSLLEDMEMCLPSTFDEWHTGEDWTWTHARGTHSRLDYIAAPLRQDVTIWASSVDYDLQLPNLHRDHELVRLDVTCSVLRSSKGKQKRRSYDWDKMATAEGQAQLKVSISQAPIKACPFKLGVLK